jgi:hypothetical protein
MKAYAVKDRDHRIVAIRATFEEAMKVVADRLLGNPYTSPSYHMTYIEEPMDVLNARYDEEFKASKEASRAV